MALFGLHLQAAERPLVTLAWHATLQTVSKYIEVAVCSGLPDNFKQMCKQVRPFSRLVYWVGCSSLSGQGCPIASARCASRCARRRVVPFLHPNAEHIKQGAR